MEKNSFRFYMQVAGRERKEVAGLIASYFGVQAVYQGTRGFGYLITEPNGREWLVDKDGALITWGTIEDNVADMFAVFKVLKENGAEAVGHVAVTISIEGHNGVSLRNLVNILASKEQLIAKVMGVTCQPFIDPVMVAAVNAVRLKTIDDFFEAVQGTSDIDRLTALLITKETITFRWFAATLRPEIIKAYIQFTFAVNTRALNQKHSSPWKKNTTNEKYGFRIFLLRLGFIGEAYGASRKLFLDRLDGNGSYRTQEQAREAVKKRKEQ